MKPKKSKRYWIAWLWLLCAIPMTCSAQQTEEPSWTQSEQGDYVKALEDSLIVLKALRPAYVNLKIVTNLQNEQYQTAMLEWRLKEKMREMQIEGLQSQVNAGRKRERKKLRVGLSIGAGIGLLIGIITY